MLITKAPRFRSVIHKFRCQRAGCLYNHRKKRSTGPALAPCGFHARICVPQTGHPLAGEAVGPSWKAASFFQVVWRLPKSWRGFALQMPRIIVSCGMSRLGMAGPLSSCAKSLAGSRWAAFFFRAGTNTSHRRFVRGRGASNGAFLFGAAMETSDFFQTEAERCKDNARKAIRKADRDFWLNLANRWETMHRIRKHEPEALVVAVGHPYNRKRFRA